MNLLTKIASVTIASGMFISANAELNTYTLDPSHTAVEWHINHFGFSNPSGKFMNIDGEIKFDSNDIGSSSVKVTIPIENINTGVPKLDEHLLGIDFFDTAKYPTAIFISNQVTNIDKDNFDLKGNLTMHGVMKPVVLHVTFNKLDLNYTKVETVGFSATTEVSRSEFDMDKYSPGLGDNIKINIELEANLQNKEK